MEKHGIEEHSTMFQLRKHLERRKVALIDDSMPFSEQDTDPSTAMAHDDAVEMEASAVCTEKSEMGNVKLCARFGCSRTHSEQLCVATCGVVLGRATFYGSEAVNGVRVSTFLGLCRLCTEYYHSYSFVHCFRLPDPFQTLSSMITTVISSDTSQGFKINISGPVLYPSTSFT